MDGVNYGGTKMNEKKHKHSEKYSFGVQIKSTTETQNSTFIYHVYSDGAPDK